jgi:type II secretory pathway pseudopilin PulG
MTRVVSASLAAALTLFAGATASAQESKSGPLARQLAAALDAAKLDSIAAADPGKAGTFVAALYFPNSQLLVVSAEYSAPQLLSDRLGKKEFRDVYIDLNSASVPASKVFIEDLAADGLKPKREENQPFDTFEMAGKRMAFDGDWKKVKQTEQDYMKAFSVADDRYAQILTALLAQLKKTS